MSKTYTIYTLIYKDKAGKWVDLEGHGCWGDDARTAAQEWASKGLVVAIRTDTYKHGNTLTSPIATQIEQCTQTS